MRTTILAPLLAFSLSVNALQLTWPKTNSADIDFSVKNEITWTTVVGDESKAQIVLVNNVVNPPVHQVIEDSIDTKDGKFELDPIVAKPGDGYQINFVRTAGSTSSGILAQSNQFKVEKSAKNETKTTTTSSAPTPAQTSETSSTPSQTPNSAAGLKTWGGVGAIAALVALMV